MEQQIFIGEGSISSIDSIVNNLNPNNIFLVRGKDSYTKSNAKVIIEKLLEGIAFSSFLDFSVNPKIEDVKKGIALFQKNHFDLIIAIGGGSVLDMAKLIKLFCETKESVINDIVIQGKQINVPFIPLIAIPTTAGTGSEATEFAVVYIDGQKFSVSNPEMLPDFAIVDPIFTYDSPEYLSACAGFDALAQAIESYWSINATIESKEYSMEALNLLWNNLLEAVKLNKKEARNKVSYGAFIAGKAINIAKTTASHALSYNITTKFKLPHGHALAVTLPYFLVYNYDVDDNNVTDKRGSAYVKDCLQKLYKAIGANSPIDAMEKMMFLIKELGLYSKISGFDISEMTRHGNKERLKNNPRIFNMETFNSYIKI